jgi:hypothetical protein
MTRHQLKEIRVGWGTKKDAGCEGLRACVVDVGRSGKVVAYLSDCDAKSGSEYLEVLILL